MVLAGSVLAAVLAGCVNITDGNAAAGNDRAPVSFGPDLAGGELYTVLLTGPEVNKIMGARSMTITGSYHRMPDDIGEMSDNVCGGVVFNAVPATYAGQGVVAVNGDRLADAPPGGLGHFVDQGVVSFVSGSEERRFFAIAQQTWQQCAHATVVYKPPERPGQEDRWTLHSPTTLRGTTSVVAGVPLPFRQVRDRFQLGVPLLLDLIRDRLPLRFPLACDLLLNRLHPLLVLRHQLLELLRKPRARLFRHGLRLTSGLGDLGPLMMALSSGHSAAMLLGNSRRHSSKPKEISCSQPGGRTSALGQPSRPSRSNNSRDPEPKRVIRARARSVAW